MKVSALHALPEFVRTILEPPDDDAPRLILAAYLEDQVSSQGEFIRL